MIVIGHVCQAILLIGMIAISWIAPRSLGLLGLIGGHLACVLGWWTMGGIAVASGIWEAHEPVEFFVLIEYAVIFNTLMLPIGITAMRRWERLSPLSRKFTSKESQ